MIANLSIFSSLFQMSIKGTLLGLILVVLMVRCTMPIYKGCSSTGFHPCQTDDQESTFDNSTTPTDSIAHAIENIFHCQTNAFKINLSFYFILQHRENGKISISLRQQRQPITKVPQIDSKPTRSWHPSELSSLSRFSITPQRSMPQH